MEIKKRAVLRLLREYYNEVQDIEAEFDEFEVAQAERALIQLDEKYADKIVRRLDV